MLRFGCGRLIGLLVMLGIAAVVIVVVKLVSGRPPAAPAAGGFCVKCGSPVRPGARFCAGCGSAIG
jgi:hypothetical protein